MAFTPLRTAESAEHQVDDLDSRISAAYGARISGTRREGSVVSACCDREPGFVRSGGGAQTRHAPVDPCQRGRQLTPFARFARGETALPLETLAGHWGSALSDHRLHVSLCAPSHCIERVGTGGVSSGAGASSCESRSPCLSPAQCPPWPRPSRSATPPGARPGSGRPRPPPSLIRTTTSGPAISSRSPLRRHQPRGPRPLLLPEASAKPKSLQPTSPQAATLATTDPVREMLDREADRRRQRDQSWKAFALVSVDRLRYAERMYQAACGPQAIAMAGG